MRKMLLSVVLAIVVFTLLVSLRAQATTELRANIKDALLWLCQCCPNHPVRKDTSYLTELVKAFDAASLDSDLDVGLLLSIGSHESGFKAGARGRIGEVGIMQVHGLALVGQDVTTLKGQVLAGARWLRKCVDKCQSIEGGIALYATGYTCNPNSAPSITRIVNSRMKLWREIDRLVFGD